MSARWTDEQLETAVWDELDGYGILGQAIACEAYVAASLILEARDERDKATLAEQDTARQYLAVCRERDAAIGRVKERDARDVYRMERIAALKAERDEALARAQQLEMLNDPEAGAKQMLMQRLAALEAELQRVREQYAELDAKHFNPVTVRRYAENERLRLAFEDWAAGKCPQRYSTDVCTMLRAAMEGKGDE